jgi:F5/8 type C domain
VPETTPTPVGSTPPSSFIESIAPETRQAATPEATPSQASAAPTPEVAPSTGPLLPPAAEHRIAVRNGADGPELYDRITGQRFIARGANYVHFVAPGGVVSDTTFAASQWHPDVIAAELQDMAAQGYTAVRIAADICQLECIGSDVTGLDDIWLDHIAAFLVMAKEAGLQVVMQTNDTPLEGDWTRRVEATCCSPFDGYMNSQYLSPVGYDVWHDYWLAIIGGLIERGAPLDAVLSWTIRGEMFLSDDKPPVSLRDGIVQTANGVIYDLTDAGQRRQMIHDGLVYWIDNIRVAIHELDPTALVSVGMYAPNEPNVWRPTDDPRLVVPEAIFDSTADYVDIHPYPGYVPFSALAENFGLRRGAVPSKPVLIGEYGAFKFAFDSPQEGASGLMDWQVDTCQYGIQGWFHWHWTGTGDLEVWTGTEDDGVLNAVLSPGLRPDPCETRAFDFMETNLARGRPTNATSTIQGFPARLAVDGAAGTLWNAGAGPEESISVDLASSSAVKGIRLQVAQSPAGPTTHEVWVRRAGEYARVHVFDGQTRDGDLLEWRPAEALLDVDAVRIVTTRSPSWVAWYEIEVLG